LNNYRAGGGGGYEMFKGKPVVREVLIEMAELMSNYVLERRKSKQRSITTGELISK